MSGIALVAHKRGITVTGSDLKESRYMRALIRDGVAVEVGHDARHMSDPTIEVVVVSTAIPDNNPELIEAQRRGLEIWPRARMLAYLAVGKKTLAVSGTHGKTTTSSMLASTLDRLKTMPTFLIGGVVDGYDSTACAGNGEYFVVEADESDGSFTFLDPDVEIVTNIEADHLDHYADLAEIERSFADFMAKLLIGGTLVVCADSPGLIDLAIASGKTFISYGLGEKADVRCFPHEDQSFSVLFADGEKVTLRLMASPGLHNMLNATAVMAVLDILGHGRQQSAEALAQFSGVRRRFDRIGTLQGITVVDDYGHHPTEIKATLQAALTLDFKRVHVLFQPHRYSRTQALINDFGSAFKAADSVTFMDIYSAGEMPIPGVTGDLLVEAVLKEDPGASVRLVERRSHVPAVMAQLAQPGDLIITMGAGDVTAMAPLILEELAKTREDVCE
ncbi:MAG: UDP-N-acetylmuramate--L-alanine ligase [Coriobacteriaceae bacterium]|nr:UDP-N-acetylmuramate--L-alanine ligase [Coriobacteriaceae bacterium]